ASSVKATNNVPGEAGRSRGGEASVMRVNEPVSSALRYDLHLEQKLLFDQPIHDEQRVGRIRCAGEQLRKESRPRLQELLDVLRVHQVSGELDDVIEARTGALQHRAEVIEDLLELCVEVMLADHLAAGVDSHLTG